MVNYKPEFVNEVIQEARAAYRCIRQIYMLATIVSDFWDDPEYIDAVVKFDRITDHVKQLYRDNNVPFNETPTT